MQSCPSVKQKVVHVLRRAGLLSAAESLYFLYQLVTHWRTNRDFLHSHPGFVAPPAAAMHDAYGSISLAVYLMRGEQIAQYFADIIRRYVPEPKSVLEWGCGPARVLRHMPEMFPDAKLYGSDYNAASIDWAKKALPGIAFCLNRLSPPLDFTQGMFDAAYAISVLTHLSQAQQAIWVAELRRVVRTGGVIIVTTHGEASSSAVLLPEEKAQLAREGMIVREGVREGKRCYLSYHDPRWVREHLFKGLEICDHIPDNPATGQDVWVLRN